MYKFIFVLMLSQGALAGGFGDILVGLRVLIDPTIVLAAQQILRNMQATVDNMRALRSDNLEMLREALNDRLEDLQRLHQQYTGLMQGFRIDPGQPGPQQAAELLRQGEEIISMARLTAVPVFEPAPPVDFRNFDAEFDSDWIQRALRETLQRLAGIEGGTENDLQRRLSGQVFRLDGSLRMDIQRILAETATRHQARVIVYTWAEGAWQQIFETGIGGHILQIYLSTPENGRSLPSGFDWDNRRGPPPPPSAAGARRGRGGDDGVGPATPIAPANC